MTGAALTMIRFGPEHDRHAGEYAGNDSLNRDEHCQ
jgi:hypothetical protein